MDQTIMIPGKGVVRAHLPVTVQAHLIRYGDRIYFPTNPRYPGDFQVLSVVPCQRDTDFRWIRLVNIQPYAQPETVRILIHNHAEVALTAHRK